MNDKYNHWLGKLLAWFNGCAYYAITLKQTTYYSCSKYVVDCRPRWRAHEDYHKIQWLAEGTFKFAVKYIYYNLRYGYKNNPYEKEAGPVS